MVGPLTGIRRSRGAGLAGQRARLVILVLCVAVATLWVGSDLLATGIRDWSASHTVASAAGLSLLLVGAGSAGYFVNSAVRRRRMDDAITATGLAAIVDCLSDIDKMLHLALANPELVSQVRTEHIAREHGRRSYRWFQRTTMSPRTADLGTSAITPDSVVIAEVADDCIRMLMAALRVWADLLSRTDSGIETMAALGELRIRLVCLKCDTEAPEDLLERICAISRYMALVFDRASGTSPYREHLNSVQPDAARSLSLDWPTSGLTVDEARRRVDRLDTAMSKVFERLTEPHQPSDSTLEQRADQASHQAAGTGPSNRNGAK